MNIFEIYLKKINEIVLTLNKKKIIIIDENLSSISVDVPPGNFNSDISTNVSMVLSKLNKKSPVELAKIIVK